MKFSELPYVRPDIDAISASLSTLTDQVKSAASVEEQIALLEQYDRLMEETATASTIAHIRSTVNTRDEYYAAEQAYCDQTAPVLEEKSLAFQQALYNSPFRPQLEERFGSLMFQNLDMAARAFSPELIPLIQEENQLCTQYQKLCASARIPFQGKTVALTQLTPYKSSPDRQIRKEAQEAEGQFYNDHQEEFDSIFDNLIKNRTKQAQTLGFKNYVELGYLRRRRNCYTPVEVDVFRRQVIEDLVPLNVEIKKEQAQRIGVDDFRFYDDSFFFPDGNPAPEGTYEELLAAADKMYTELSPETAAFICRMMDDEMFDLLSKDGKAPGGFCSYLPTYGCSFIYSNFNGTAGDVDVLTHEAGHAFFNYMSKAIRPAALRKPTMEACETHSMSMEFLTAPWHHLFFGSQTAKYERFHAQSALLFIPYGCMVDHFQELVYANPNWTPKQRNDAWLELEHQYRPYLNFDEIPCFERGAGWQRQRHIYLYPFYYIDYTMAQTMSLQFWVQSMENWQNAWNAYLDFIRMGGTKTFTDMVKAAGMLSPLEEGSLKIIASGIKSWLDTHPLEA